ncbi:hypothetical protein OHV05_10155 [Kitasatospora sp. NBC_00070]|uniref:hypothetical protein n=1 Tax=Kitasatospora sp. NBC_00070 TaxID=2975962 RepID=UPI0032484F65
MFATSLQRPVTVEIEDVTQPATFNGLADAVAAVWNSLRALPLGHLQYDAYRDFFGEGAVERVSKFLDRDGELLLSFAMAGRSHFVLIRPASASARRR